MENDKSYKVELLSPAGSLECVKVAIDAGADAVYMGGSKFSARAFAKSASEDSILEAIKFVKSANKKFYLTITTLFKQKELKEIFVYLDPMVEAGVDAFIIYDLGVAKLLKEKYKNVELHASTQMMTTSSKAIKLLKSLGFSQVVLSRELGLKEIKEIKKEVKDEIKLETFIHGSMCYCYSGACLMSSFIGGESGNRGRCKGPCRLEYVPNGANKNYKEKYLLSMKDMCAISALKQLMDIGVYCFKIEGRMRKPEYVREVTKIYRKYIDAITNGTYDSDIKKKIIDFKSDERKLLDAYNKGGFANYYDNHNSESMIQRFQR